jgi:predicted nucleic acid-binding protein
LSFDLAGSLRALKPQKRTGPLRRRPDGDLAWADAAPLIGGALLLDTSVYLDALRGSTPEAADGLLSYRVCHHSAVCLAELTRAFGRLDPAHPSTAATLATLGAVIADIPGRRLHAPASEAWGDAGMLAGVLFRLSGLPRGAGHERRLLNDALIFLQARGLGASVLTANVRDFDYLEQLLPNGRVIFYRRPDRGP